MKIHFRIDSQLYERKRNCSLEDQTSFSVFINDRYCGHLEMSKNELVHFFMIFRHGLSPTMDTYVETGKLDE